MYKFYSFHNARSSIICEIIRTHCEIRVHSYFANSNFFPSFEFVYKCNFHFESDFIRTRLLILNLTHFFLLALAEEQSLGTAASIHHSFISSSIFWKNDKILSKKLLEWNDLSRISNSAIQLCNDESSWLKNSRIKFNIYSSSRKNIKK